MAVYFFDGNNLKMMLRGAVDLLGQSTEEINDLNVFPVPDGDTGTNMYQTLEAAANEAYKMDSSSISLVAKAAARGGLLGARGNSGVILSQILHGFADSLQFKEKASAQDIVSALENGTQTAYRAVMTPVEGTILTVLKKSAEGAASQHSDNLLRIMVAILKNAFTALQETPKLLPVLKEAGVVDAGGKGLVVILEGILHALKSASPKAKTLPASAEVKKEVAPKSHFKLFESSPALDFTYCTEFLLKGHNLPLDGIKEKLSPHGDCLMVVGREETAKVHIHTNHPGLVLESCLNLGTLHDIKISNMLDQNDELIEKSEQDGIKKSYGVISIGAGKGIAEIMKNLGADIVIAGGQTLNPSTGEFLNVIDEVPFEKIIILPNNKNIILAAEQAGELSWKEIVVIPSKSIPQGISALLTINPQEDFETTARKMLEARSSVRTGEITTAVRDTVYKELVVKKGDLIGLAEGDLIKTGNDISEVLEDLLKNIIEGEGRLVTLYSGETLDISQAEELAEKMGLKFGAQDFEVQYGGQPVYDLIISVE